MQRWKRWESLAASQQPTASNLEKVKQKVLEILIGLSYFGGESQFTAEFIYNI